MANEQNTQPAQNENDWSDKQNRTIGWFGLLLIILAIILMFGALSVAYFITLGNAKSITIGLPQLAWVNTLVLIISSFTMAAAHNRIKADDRKGFSTYLYITFGFGVLFLVMQLWAMTPVFFGKFRGMQFPVQTWLAAFGILHGAHILTGLAVLGSMLKGNRAGRYSKANYQPVSLGGAYWHFLDFLWIWMFVLLLIAEYK